jgi:hypothetical protein
LEVREKCTIFLEEYCRGLVTKRKTEGKEWADLREYNPWLKCIADGLAE